jgi:hypothetical protein
MKKILLFAAVLIPFLTFSNEEFKFEIKGTVTDIKKHEPLPFTSIYLVVNEDTISQVQSDFDGNYILKFPKYNTYDVHIRNMGFKPQIHQSVVFDQAFFERHEPFFHIKMKPICMDGHPYYYTSCDCFEKQNPFLASEIRGKITDKTTGEPYPFVNIVLIKNGVQVTGGQTDFDGMYVIKPIPEGKYTIKISYYGDDEMVTKDIAVRAKTTHFINFNHESKMEELESQTVINSIKSKLIEHDPTGKIKGKLIDSETKDPIPFANLVLEINGVHIMDGQADFDGNFRFGKLPPGKYTIKTQSIGYKPSAFIGINVKNEKTFSANLKIEPNSICLTYCCGYTQPKIEPEPITDLFSEQDSLNAEDDKLLPSSDFSSKAGMTGFTAYPNPTSGELKMENLSGIDEVNLIRIDGSIIKSIKTGLMASKTIDMSFLTPGIYFLQYMEEDKLQSHRIIKF